VSTIEISFRCSNIDFVSDRTARETLKRFSKIVRRAQVLEINYLLSRQQLSLAERQSVRDRSISYIASAPLMEIQSANKGSWKIVALLGAFGVWFLSNTVGESIKDGWSKNAINKDIVNYIAKIRPKKFIEFIREALANEEFEGRWEVVDIKVKEKNKKTQYTITLTPKGVEGKSYPEFVDGQYVIKRLNKDLKSE